MKIHNFLPNLLKCVEAWKQPPSVREFTESYYEPMSVQLADAFESGPSMHGILSDLDWRKYREKVLTLDPHREEARVRKHVHDVSELFGLKLEGEIILFGSFETIDGYARFNEGKHRVYLGVDESHGRTDYLDVLEVHELAHVARESRPEIWKGWGLNPLMNHDEFVEVQPTIEHVFGEGFSCAISEILAPCEENQPWRYVYQEEADFKRIMQNATAVDLAVHGEIQAGNDGDWSRLYRSSSYRPHLPTYTHYVWGWAWAKKMIASRGGGDPRKLLSVCSKEFVSDALEFTLSSSSYCTSHSP